MDIYLCPSPELYQIYHRPEASVIIVDIFRASTTITTALQNGAEAVLPVATVEECQAIGESRGYLMAAERNVLRCDFAQLGNDPLEYREDLVRGRCIVITTTNGTRSLSIAREAGAKEILIGSFRNLAKTLEYLKKQERKEILVLAAGWRGQVSSEDTLYAGALAYEAQRLGYGRAMNDATTMMQDLWMAHCLTKEGREEYLKGSEHFARLSRAGHADALSYCLTEDTAPAILLDVDGYLRAYRG